MSRKNIQEFYRRLKESDPHPKGELNYVNEYTLLVAVVLSAQATDIGVNRATQKLFQFIVILNRSMIYWNWEYMFSISTHDSLPEMSSY